MNRFDVRRRHRRRAWRHAGVACLGLCVAWLVIENAVLLVLVLALGPAPAAAAAAPVLRAALAMMTPLWLLPALFLVAGLAAGRAAHRAHALRRSNGGPA